MRDDDGEQGHGGVQDGRQAGIDPRFAPRDQDERNRRVEGTHEQVRGQVLGRPRKCLALEAHHQQEPEEAKEEPNGRQRRGTNLADGDLDPQKRRPPNGPEKPERAPLLQPHAVSFLQRVRVSHTVCLSSGPQRSARCHPGGRNKKRGLSIPTKDRGVSGSVRRRAGRPKVRNTTGWWGVWRVETVEVRLCDFSTCFLRSIRSNALALRPIRRWRRWMRTPRPSLRRWRPLARRLSVWGWPGGRRSRGGGAEGRGWGAPAAGASLLPMATSLPTTPSW